MRACCRAASRSSGRRRDAWRSADRKFGPPTANAGSSRNRLDASRHTGRRQGRLSNPMGRFERQRCRLGAPTSDVGTSPERCSPGSTRLSCRSLVVEDHAVRQVHQARADWRQFPGRPCSSAVPRRERSPELRGRRSRWACCREMVAATRTAPDSLRGERCEQPGGRLAGSDVAAPQGTRSSAWSGVTR